MEENKVGEGKKITLGQLISIIINGIIIVCMLVIIGKGFIQEKCTGNSSSILNDLGIANFNSKFSMYEGVFSGAKVKQLLAYVISNNNEEYPYNIITINGIVPKSIPSLRSK